MGNAIFTSRVKGITMHYAKSHMSDYQKGDFLRIVPDFNNPHDNHALAIYDDNKHMIGFVDKYSNVSLYESIKDNDYVCLITSVYNDSTKPSIEYQVIYRTTGNREAVSNSTFENYLSKYNKQKKKSRNERVVFSGDDFDKVFCDDRTRKYRDSIYNNVITLINNGQYALVVSILSRHLDFNESRLYVLLAGALIQLNVDTKNYDETEKYCKKAIEFDDESGNLAIVLLGTIYKENEKFNEAYKYFKRAAEKGISSSYYSLGSLYLFGEGVGKNERLAFLYASLAANERDQYGEFMLGTLYDEGVGTQQNKKKALEYYKKAVEDGSILAVKKVADFYAKGIGCEVNEDIAVKYYEISNNYEYDTEVEYQLGLLYKNKGRLKEALEKLERAYDEGIDNASLEIGCTYMQMKDNENATKWLNIAKDAGIAMAKVYLELIEYGF